MTKFGEQLVAARKKRSMSAKMLAEACGVSRSYITLIENDKRRPNPKLIPIIAEKLHLKTNVVLNWYLESMKTDLQRKMDGTT